MLLEFHHQRARWLQASIGLQAFAAICCANIVNAQSSVPVSLKGGNGLYAAVLVSSYRSTISYTPGLSSQPYSFQLNDSQSDAVQSGDSISLKASNGQYLAALSTSTRYGTTYSLAMINGAYTFTIAKSKGSGTLLPGDGITLKSAFGQYLAVLTSSTRYGTTSELSLSSAPYTFTIGMPQPAQPAMKAFSITPSTVNDGDGAVGTIDLKYAALQGGKTIPLSSSDPAAAPSPDSITIPEGKTSATFSIPTYSTLATHNVTFTANGGSTRRGDVSVSNNLSANLKIVVPVLSSFALDSASVNDGDTDGGVLRLNGPAPVGGMKLALSVSDTSAATVPESVTVPQGATSIPLTVTSKVVPANTRIIVKAMDPAGNAQYASVVVVHCGQLASEKLHFQTLGQSYWLPGQPGGFVYDLPLTKSWNFNTSVGGYYNPHFGPWKINLGLFSITIPGFSLGDFGAQAKLASQGKAGLNFHAYASSGSVNVNLPVTVNIHFPDQGSIYAGDSFLVYSSYSVDDSATLSTTSPAAGASLQAVFQAQNTAHVNAKAFGDNILDVDLLPNSLRAININKTLFDTGDLLGKETSRDYDLKGFVSGTVKTPRLNTAGGINSAAAVKGTLTASGSDTFLTARGSITNLITSLFGLPLSYSWSTSLPGGGIDAYFGLLQLTYGANFNLQQNFQFVPRPRVRLSLSNGQYIEFYAGDTIQMQMPTDNPVITVTPTYMLDNTFTSKTSVVIDHNGKFTPLEIKASASAFNWKLASFDFVPWSTSFGDGQESFSLWDKNFALGGFSTPGGAPITIVGRRHFAPVLTASVPAQMTFYVVDDNDPKGSLDAFQKFAPSTTTVTLNGNNFTPGTAAQLDYFGASLPLNTQVLDATTLSIDVPNIARLLPGVARLTVTTPYGKSNTLDLPVAYPVPQLAKAGPNLWASDPDFNNALLSVIGTDFIDRPDYFQAPNPNLPGRLLQKFWTTAFPQGKTMPAFFPQFNFNATAPLPTVYWDNQPMALYVEPTPSGFRPSLLPHAYFDRSRRVPVYIMNPGGSKSESVYAFIGAPTPSLTGLAPQTAHPGDAGFRLVVKGESHIPDDPHDLDDPTALGFEANSVVYFNGKPRPTTFISATEIQADISTEDLAVGAINQITVVSPFVDVNGQQGTFTSNAIAFEVRNPQPMLTGITPSAAVSADPAFDGTNLEYNLAVQGSGFVSNSVVTFNGKERKTRFVSDQLLEVAVLAEDVALPGVNTIQVSNPTPGGGLSGMATLTVTNAKPTLTKLTPNPVPLNSDATLVVEGTGFYAGTVVSANGNALKTTWVAANVVTAVVPASLLAKVGTLTITAANPKPDGGISNAITLAIAKGNTTLTVPSITGTLNKTVTLMAHLQIVSNNADLAGKPVVFSVNGKPLGTGTTNASGSATLQFTLNAKSINIGANTITVKFAGDSSYNGSEGTGTLTVLSP